MGEREKYVKREDQAVIAVQLDLETDGFAYRKWGGVQRCKRGDWIVDHDGEVYTVDRDTFLRTYRKVDAGRYVKVTPVWAERAAREGQIPTKEGATAYRPGDYLVFNEEDGGDPYAVAAEHFVAMYRRAE